MNLKTKIKSALKNPQWIIVFLNNRGLHFLNDERYIKLLYKLKFNKKIDLENPKTFNEKLQWLKLNNRKDIYVKMVDKYEVKNYVADIIGEQYIIPTIGIYNDVDEIDFKRLPNQFVLKTTHYGGNKGIYIVKDKTKFDINKCRKNINKIMKKNLFYSGREWPYKSVKPRIIIEKYLSNDGNELDDYKIHSFNGMPKIILVCKDRNKATGITEDFFDNNWNHLNVKRPNIKNSSCTILKPNKIEEMIEMTKKLTTDIPFARVDFYVVKDSIFFGEITFYPASGLEKFEPDEFDKQLGDLLEL